MRSMFVLMTMLLLGQNASAQPFEIGTPIKVLNFGEIYTTYAWDEASKISISADFALLTDDLVNRSTESGWPKGIANLDARSSNQKLMYDYTLFFLTMMNDHVAILYAPKIENSSMPADMRPETDIYFIINVHAIEEKKLELPETSSVGFAAQMDEITRDFQNGFANVVNQEIQRDEDALLVYYGTQVPMDGSDEIYFVEDLMSASTIFHAGFPGHTDPAVGLRTYQELVQKVETLKLTCCFLTKNEELATGNRRSQTFQTYSPNGKMDIAFQNMIIEVGLEQGETFDDEGQILDFWIPVLSVYEK